MTFHLANQRKRFLPLSSAISGSLTLISLFSYELDARCNSCAGQEKNFRYSSAVDDYAANFVILMSFDSAKTAVLSAAIWLTAAVISANVLTFTQDVVNPVVLFLILKATS